MLYPAQSNTFILFFLRFFRGLGLCPTATAGRGAKIPAGRIMVPLRSGYSDLAMSVEGLGRSLSYNPVAKASFALSRRSGRKAPGAQDMIERSILLFALRSMLLSRKR